MRVILQRVKEASVTIDGQIVGAIGKGFLLLVGFSQGDDATIIEKVVKKIAGMRIFEDENGRMNKELKDVDGSILSISQFTLYADVASGKRPSFVKALQYDKATILYDIFNQKLKETGIPIAQGVFGADMKVRLLNDGPVTIVIDSEDL